MINERVYRSEGIVVHRRNQGEADRILTLCTPQGKVQVVAKGARKVRSRKAGHLELFAHAQLTLARSRSSWDIVTQAETVAPNTALRGDLVRGTYARYAVELYDRFIAEGEGGPSLFDLLARMLAYLCEEERLDLLARAYEQRLLMLVGFRPEWEHCVGERGGGLCERPLDPHGERPFGLDPERGGGLCPDCYHTHRQEHAVVPLSPAALQLFQALQREPFVQVREMPVSPVLLEEVERAARHYITYYLERDVQTGRFMRRLDLNRQGEGAHIDPPSAPAGKAVGPLSKM
ncbi:MAG: DNA repair protein RecO [Anaerolineae bacterium]|nr:DNA repair protein RecO [Anaerolineae bacterium]